MIQQIIQQAQDRAINSLADEDQRGGIARSGITTNRAFFIPVLQGANNKKEENEMTNNFLVKTMIKCFGETKTIKMLNQVQMVRINKKARKYRATIKAD